MEVILCPAIEGMIVAVGAAKAETSTGLSDQFGMAAGVCSHTAEAGSTIGVGITGGQQQLPNKLIQRSILGHSGSQPNG
jgi:hypothetical protein